MLNPLLIEQFRPLGRGTNSISLVNLAISSCRSTDRHDFMYSSALETLARKATINIIDLYQQYFFSYKRFTCSYRILCSRSSRSQYVKNLMVYQFTAATLIQRFQDCALAAQKLQNQQNQGGCIVISCPIPI